MQKVHFIAIGGSSMHCLAIAMSQKNNFLVTGSDEKIYDPSYSRLKEYKLLPDKMGWYPERVHTGISAVIVGMHVAVDNPELVKAKELGLKVFSFPEFLFQQTRSKTRIVVAGSYGKSTTAAIILYVLKQLKMDTDYVIGALPEGFENRNRLSYEARIALFEGSERRTSPLDSKPIFLHYKPHIAVITGVAWDHYNEYPDFRQYVELFRKFVDQMEVQGRLICNSKDEYLNDMLSGLRRDLVAFTYDTPEYEIRNGVTWLKTKKKEIKLNIFGEHNLQNIEAARIACRQAGVSDDQFYSVIDGFPGLTNRLETVFDNGNTLALLDNAHSPAMLKACLRAAKQQFPEKKLIVCSELCTPGSLNVEFLPQYSDSLALADLALIYYNPETIRELNLPPLTPDSIKKAFGRDDIDVFSNKDELLEKLKKIAYNHSTLLYATSGDFGGLDVRSLTPELVNTKR